MRFMKKVCECRKTRWQYAEKNNDMMCIWDTEAIDATKNDGGGFECFERLAAR